MYEQLRRYGLQQGRRMPEPLDTMDLRDELWSAFVSFGGDSAVRSASWQVMLSRKGIVVRPYDKALPPNGLLGVYKLGFLMDAARQRSVVESYVSGH